jgi:hypothetical protein
MVRPQGVFHVKHSPLSQSLVSRETVFVLQTFVSRETRKGEGIISKNLQKTVAKKARR